jgi:hypothetical protein
MNCKLSHFYVVCQPSTHAIEIFREAGAIKLGGQQIDLEEITTL